MSLGCPLPAPALSYRSVLLANQFIELYLTDQLMALVTVPVFQSACQLQRSPVNVLPQMHRWLCALLLISLIAAAPLIFSKRLLTTATLVNAPVPVVPAPESESLMPVLL